MHPSSLENMQWCYRRYAAPRILGSTQEFTVLDVGGANHNGSYADVFSAPNVRYIGMDLAAGPGVEVVLQDPYRFPQQDASVDFVISGQMLEHCELFWLAFAEMVRVLKPDGFLFLIAPSGGPIHRYPVDCYRYYPDAYRALAKHANCHVVDLRHDDRGPWNDLVGVFSRTPRPKALPHPATKAATAPVAVPPGTPEQEAVRGARPYLEVLQELHEGLRPRAYLEIGVRNGRSLQLAGCPALGIDPEPDLTVELPATTHVLRMTSDDFFELETARLRDLAPDFVFIDGMHLFEFALRDFMHVERLLAPGTVVVIDDVFPNHPSQARRERSTRVWTGDVWRLFDTLQKMRPDLALCALDTAPTGLLVIAALSPDHRALWQRYNPTVRTIQCATDAPPAAILERHGAVSPQGEPLARLIGLLQQYRAAAPTDTKARETLRRGLRQLAPPHA
ncbi:methyltransferase domain-containing protein [Ramlibacter sp. PS3R-8]|uniref:methyltransferase domain-containing protein n=1 Tax=Ramlibacter sp. PS3R-8 TaxID=3133437 RepID=UPI0030A0329E